MTVTIENRRPSRSFTLRWIRFVVLTLVLSMIGVAVVDFAKPERRFRASEVVASVQVRVVRNAAPTVESLQRRILSNEELQDLWDDFFASATEPSELRRETELVEWRRRLRVEVDPGPIGDLRSIRITWSGLDDLDMGAAIVESLARRYADEVSADRWYGSVDRLRTQVRDVEAAAKDLTAVRQRQASATEPMPDVAPAASFEPVPDDRMNAPLLIAPNADGSMPAAVEKPKPKKIAFPPSPAAASARYSDDPARRIAAATASLRREMDEMLLPREAEFPVVTLDRVGISVAHLRPLWNGGVVLLSLLLAAACSVTRVTSEVAVVSEPVRKFKVDEVAATETVASVPSPASTTATATAATIGLAAEPEESSVPGETSFQTVEEVEARLAAPVLAVVSRRANRIEPIATQPVRRAA